MRFVSVKASLHIILTGEATYTLSAHIERGGRTVSVVENQPLHWEQNAERQHMLHMIREGKGKREEIDNYIRTLGAQLYQAVFGGLDNPVQKAFQTLQHVHYGHSVRLILTIGSAVLSELPWEALYDDQYLSVRGDIPIVRRMPTRTASPNRRPLQGTLQVLLVWASPIGLNTLKLAETTTRLKQVIEHDVKRSGLFARRMKVTIIPHVSLEKLRAELVQNPGKYHILCFAGHGTDTALYFEYGMNGESTGEAYEVSARTFAEHINTSRLSLRLIYLMACEAGAVGERETNSTEPLVGFARQLAQQREVAAVVAMQTRVNYRPIEDFTVDFFRRLTHFQDVDSAIAESRVALLVKDRASRDFLAPVLYLQSRDSRLFRAAFPWLLALLVGMTLLFIGAVVVGAVQTEYQRRREIILLQDATSEQLQLAGVLSQRRDYVTNGSPSQQVIAGDTLWVLSGNRHLQALPLDQMTTPVEVSFEGELGTLVGDGTTVWVGQSSDGAGNLLHVLPDGTVETFAVGDSPLTPLLTTDFIWVQSKQDRRMTRISRTGETDAISFRTDIDAGDAFSDGRYVWLVLEGETEFMRFGADGDQSFETDDRLLTGTVGGGWLWLTTESGELQQVDPETGDIVRRTRLAPMIRIALIEADAIWLIENNGGRILRLPLLDSASTEPLVMFSLDQQPRRMLAVGNYLWITTDQDRLFMVDPETNTVIYHFDVPGSGALTAITSVGDQIWITSSGQDTLLILDAENQREPDRINLCSGVSSPRLDGVNIWLMCTYEKRIIVMPAHMFYSGITGSDDFNQVLARTPLTMDGYLWVPQPFMGRVLVYQDDTLLANIEIGGVITAFIADSPYIWIGTQDGRIFRLSYEWVGYDLIDRLYDVKHFVVNQDAFSVGGQVNTLFRAGNNIWVLHYTFGDIQNADNLSRIDRTTGAVHSENVGIPSGWMVQENTGDVWLSFSSETQGLIVRYDERTGAEIDRYTFPNPVASPWGAVEVDGDLWFTAGGVPLNAIGVLLERLFTDTIDRREIGLYRFDPDTNNWVGSYDTLPAPGAPTVAVPYLWFTSNMFVVITDSDQPTSGFIFAIDTRSGDLLGPWNPCASTSAPYAIQDSVWVGCDAPDTSLYHYQGTPPEQTRIESVGSDPWSPVSQNNVVWFTFQSSRTTAAVDANTGDLLFVSALNGRPSAPFLYQGQVWTYLMDKGVLQELSIHTGATERGSH